MWAARVEGEQGCNRLPNRPCCPLSLSSQHGRVAHDVRNHGQYTDTKKPQAISEAEKLPPMTEQPTSIVSHEVGRPQSRLASRLAILLFATMVLGPILGREVPREVGRWYYAAAVNASEAGDLPAAVRYLERAIEWHGVRSEYLLLRAELHWKQNNQAAAEADMAQAVAVAPVVKRIVVYRARSELHLKMGQWQAAVADWEEILKLVESDNSPLYSALPRDMLYNSLAYMRALANRDLEKALEEVNLALAQDADNAAYLDTRGYIYYRMGKYGKALEDLNRAAERAREDWQRQRKRAEELRKHYIDVRPVEKIIREIDRNYAVILYHRALVQDLFDAEKARLDFSQIERLGFVPGPNLY